MDKFEQINHLIKEYAQTGEKGNLDEHSLEDIKKAKGIHQANSVHPWFSKYDEIIVDREKRKENLIEVHKHYRGIAIGHTATTITLSTLQAGFLVDYLKEKEFFSLGNLIGSLALIFFGISILISVLSQFYIFKGYFCEARGNTSKANKRYFGPADKMMRHVFYTFLGGTFFTLAIVLKWLSIMIFGIFSIFWWAYRKDKFFGELGGELGGVTGGTGHGIGGLTSYDKD